MNILSKFEYLLNLFYPKICMSCSQALNSQEETICIKCLLRLPKTGFHFHEDNPISRVFWGRIDIAAATSFLFFSKQGRVQSLMHNLKYRGQKEVGIYLGKLFGNDLKESPLFQNIDLIIPIPLHPKKLATRGFNQSMMIAKGLSESMELPINEYLQRSIHTSTQTKKSRYDRWKNVKDIFEISESDSLKNKNILLVDDVLTTGATLEAGAGKLLEVEGTKVYIATLAYANI
ncbi:MAG: hypothetical protein C0598_08730 [Marinilabiliales bacterium]|nr:MAG: hypothetical protein C0598_08730 [Marinilabiliales bacterium]